MERRSNEPAVNRETGLICCVMTYVSLNHSLLRDGSLFMGMTGLDNLK